MRQKNIRKIRKLRTKSSWAIRAALTNHSPPLHLGRKGFTNCSTQTIIVRVQLNSQLTYVLLIPGIKQWLQQEKSTAKPQNCGKFRYPRGREGWGVGGRGALPDSCDPGPSKTTTHQVRKYVKKIQKNTRYVQAAFLVCRPI